MARRLITLLLASAMAVVGSLIALPRAAFATATPNTVFYWNDVLLEAFRREGGGPGPLARAAAMMHTGIFDAVNGGWWSHRNGVGNGLRSYNSTILVDSSVDDDLAAGIVARDVLIAALPRQRAYIDQAYTARHGSASQPAATELAGHVSGLMLFVRRDDGAAAPPTYTFDNVPGAWRLTGHLCTAPTDPHWGRVKPFVMDSPAQFRRPPTSRRAAVPGLRTRRAES